MSFDDRLRQSLDAAGRSLRPVQPPTAELIARAHRRRHTVLSLGGGACALVIIVVATVWATSGAKPGTRVDVAAHSTSTLGALEQGPSGAVTAAPPGATTSTTGSGGPTASTGSIAPSGTAYAPPASVVHPNDATTLPPRATTTTVPATTGDVVVTQNDAGKTFALRRGQHLVVNLQGSGWDYSEPASDNSSVLPRLSGSADPATGDATATFFGQGGQAHVSSTKDAPCRRANPPCMVPTYLFQITVNVV